MLYTVAINTSETIRTQTGLDTNSRCCVTIYRFTFTLLFASVLQVSKETFMVTAEVFLYWPTTFK